MPPMHNFVSFAECVNRPTSLCLLSWPSLVLYGLGIAAVVWGFCWFSQDRARFIAWARWVTGVGILFIIVPFFIVLCFFGVDPDVIMGVEVNVVVNALWITTIFAFGFGLILMFAVLSLWTGALGAKITRKGQTS